MDSLIIDYIKINHQNEKTDTSLLAFPFFCIGQDNIYSVTSLNGLKRDKPGQTEIK